MTRASAAAAIALALLAGPAAQEPALVREHPGSWQGARPIAPRLPPELAAGERAEVAASVNQLLDILRRAPHLAPQPGFQVIPHASAAVQALDHSETKRKPYVTAEVVANLAPYERTPRGVEANESDTAASVTIDVNDLRALLGGETGMSDDEGTFMSSPPEPVATLHGYPVFEEGNGDRWVVIRRNAVPFFAPVTRGRFMQATIRDLAQQLATARDRRSKIPAGIPADIVATVDGAIAQFQRALANSQSAYNAMSAADRAAPAYGGARSGDEAPTFTGDDPSSAIVYVNPALVDASAPRAAPQLLAIRITAKTDRWPDLAEALDKELDWAALDRFVRR